MRSEVKNMTVTVKLFANFREMVGERELSVQAEKVKEVLAHIREEHEELSSKIFTNQENLELEEHVIIMVNGRKIEMLDGVETTLEDGDDVSILPPVAGG